MAVAKPDNTGVNKWEEQWKLLCPRPEWDNPAYWEACRGIMPARTVEG